MKPVEPSPGPLAESQKMALVSLLADDDPSVYQTVRGKLISYGPVAAEWVKRGALSTAPVLRRPKKMTPRVRHFGLPTPPSLARKIQRARKRTVCAQ